MGLPDNPLVYDLIQVFAGRHVSDRRLRRAIASAGDQTVLDIGAGTGSLAGLLPAGAIYWALDNDPAKLSRLSSKVPDAHCLLRSALDTGLSDRAVEWTVCAAVAHHLDDDELPRLFSELARVTRYRLVFLDALSTSKHNVARLLWRYDRGSHPRSAEALLSALGRYFEVERVEYFRVFHRYLLCSCRPTGFSRDCTETP
jgi:SAM-dependent methyltransferase